MSRGKFSNPGLGEQRGDSHLAIGDRDGLS